jgi:hypothetical protein
MAYSLPIIIGKNIEKSEEAKEYVRLNFVIQVFSSYEFNNAIDSFLYKNQAEARLNKREYFMDRIHSMDTILQIAAKYVTLR